MANEMKPSVSKEIASVTTFLRNDKRLARRLPRRAFSTARNDNKRVQEPCPRTASKCKDAKKSGVSPSIREGSGKLLCLGENS